MRLQIVPTEILTEIDGVEVRVWNGITQDGIQCFVFVHRLAVRTSDDQTRFEIELKEKMPPGTSIPLKQFM